MTCPSLRYASDPLATPFRHALWKITAAAVFDPRPPTLYACILSVLSICILGLRGIFTESNSIQFMQVVTDFFDEMKSRSKGYASMEYQLTGYRENKLVRLDVKVNQEVCTGPAPADLSLLAAQSR